MTVRNPRHYIDEDNGDVTIDNRDPLCTELRYKRYPDHVFVVDIRFALDLVKNALENKGVDVDEPLLKSYFDAIEYQLNE